MARVNSRGMKGKMDCQVPGRGARRGIVSRTTSTASSRSHDLIHSAGSARLALCGQSPSGTWQMWETWSGPLRAAPISRLATPSHLTRAPELTAQAQTELCARNMSSQHILDSKNTCERKAE